MRKLYKETTVDATMNMRNLYDEYDYIQIEMVGNVIIYESIEKPYDKLTPIENLHTKESQPDESVKDSLPASAVDVTNIKITKEELVQLLYNNFYNKRRNEINLDELDFTQFKCDIALNGLKVDGSLFQQQQEISKFLCQVGQKIGEGLYQGYQEVGLNLFQDHQIIGGSLYQEEQVMGGSLNQENQVVGGAKYQNEQPISGEICQAEEEENK